VEERMTWFKIEWPKMIEVVPEGERGEAKVTHFEVDEKASRFTSLRAAVNMCSGEYVPPGRYARLVVGRDLMMSDTEMEQSTNSCAVYAANGDVLIAGMGLGVMLIPVCRKPEVKSVLVIERSADVIALVEPYVRKFLGKDAEKLIVLNMDIFDLQPPKGKKWDTIWFDIWPNVCEDNLDGLGTLKRRFSKRLNRENPKCWMGAWEEDRLRYLRQQSKRQDKEMAFWRRPMADLSNGLPKEVDGVKL
jgi:hypothetical protein